MSAYRLTYAQLADLLNYMVGLPQRDGMRITRDRISVCVVQTWVAKHERARIEHICEMRLVQVGIIPPPTGSKAGRPLGELPRQVQQVLKYHGVML